MAGPLVDPVVDPLVDPDSLRGRIAQAYREACAAELAALKPGNVHRYADGHGMCAADFMASAQASVVPLTDPSLSLGERLYRSVAATRAAVGCNTNLGILLLCAPLVPALLDRDAVGGLRQRVVAVLRGTDREDTEWFFRAIRLASPAGLGTSGRYDVAGAADAPLLEVMAHAAPWDRIARAYADGFRDLFGHAAPRLAHFMERWGDESWAATALYMDLLGRHPDTHVARKQGTAVAESVRRRAAPLAHALARCSNPEDYREALLALDREFKQQGINPGTSADFTVASLLILRLEPMGCQLEPITGSPRVPGPRAVEAGTKLNL
jgi:triphosphoribosyl-dephospho-CoA synthase